MEIPDQGKAPVVLTVSRSVRGSATRALTENLSSKKGGVVYNTGDNDGKIDICIQARQARRDNPVRMSIRINADLEEQDEDSASKDEVAAKENTLGDEQVKTQMTRLERDIKILEGRVKNILNNADFNKDQMASFHDQSVAMSRASTYWPIIRLSVLVITGFTQVNHIIRFMKNHHIGI